MRAYRVAGSMVALALLVTTSPIGAAAAIDVKRDVQYGTANGKPLLLDAYVPPGGADRRPAVVMIHGGGWRTGDKASWAPEANKLADHGWVAFSVNYRLDEPSAFPAEVEDVQAAVRWVRSKADEYRVDPKRIAAVGESAGGHLTSMLATLGSGALDSDARIRVGAAWSPPVDLSALARLRGDQWAAPLFGCTLTICPERLTQASPVTYVDPSDAPLYLINSADEQVPLSQAQSMAARLDAAGIDHRLDVLPGGRHALDFRQDAWAPTIAFLDEHLAAPTQHRSFPTGAVVLAAGVAAAAVGAAVLIRRRAS